MSSIESSNVDSVISDSRVQGRGIKRKKRKSFIQNARKYGRKGTYGRGSNLDEDTYQYMVRVLELMRDNAFPTFEEKLIFVNNVYEQTIDNEVEYSRNQIGSRVIDILMRYASFEVIKRFASAFMEVIRPICSDRFASHVLQRILNVCAERGTRNLNDLKPVNDDQIKVEETEIEVYNDWVIKLSKYLMNNMEDFVWDTYANHIVRTVVELLGGLISEAVEGSDSKSRRNEAQDLTKRRKVPDEYKELLLEICKRLSVWPQLPEFPNNELTSGLLQKLLYSMKDVDKKTSKALLEKVVTVCFNSDDESQVSSSAFGSESSMRLLEACIAVARQKIYTRIYGKFFINRLGKLSLMMGANFTVQRLFGNCQSKEELEAMFDEISTHFLDILEKGNLGVIASVADACKRLQARQGPFINAMAKTLRCEEPSERQNTIALLVARMKPFENTESEVNIVEFRVNLHGSLILQSMLNFNKPIKIVNSLLAASGIELKTLFADPRGSRVMDAFAESKFIGEKSREKMSRRLSGQWVQLACSKHGSRSLEKVWQWSQIKQRIWIIEELASAGASLLATETGKIISAKLNVPLFSRSRKEWMDAQGKEEKTKALFADIIGEVKTE